MTGGYLLIPASFFISLKRESTCQIVKALKKHSRGLGDWVNPVESSIRIHLHEANRIFVGFLFDRQVKTELAWEAAGAFTELIDAEDHIFWEAVQDIEKERLVGFMRYGWGDVQR